MAHQETKTSMNLCARNLQSSDLRGQNSSEQIRNRELKIFSAVLSVLLIVLLPVFSVTYLPGVDLPNHLARHYIGHALNNSLDLQTFYTFDWRLIPNLAGDAIASLLDDFLHIHDVGRAIFALSLSLWVIVPVVLNRVLWGRFSAWPLFVALVVYNGNVAWGFENYVLGSALAVLAFVVWVGTDKMRLDLRLLLFTMIATLVYLGHLLAFGFLGLSVVTYEVGRSFRAADVTKFLLIKKVAFTIFPFSPATIHFIAVTLQAPPTHGSGTAYDMPRQLFQALLSPTSAFQASVDIVVFLVVSLSLYISIRVFGWLKVHPTMVPVLWCTALVAAIMPTLLLGVGFTDIRLPFVVVALVIASCRFEGGRLPQRLLTVLFLGALCLRVGTLLVSWRAHEIEVTELVASFRQLPMAPRILVVSAPEEGTQLIHYHSASYAVIERHAFLPNLFTGGFPLKTVPELRRLDHPQPTPLPLHYLDDALRAGGDALSYLPGRPHVFWRTWWQDFTHVLVFGKGEQLNCLSNLLNPVSDGSFFVLYSVQTRTQADRRLKGVEGC
ncbi:hypothetical protein [Microvirga arabica]|uniref:hypothetical protein n=1 Tax=Microvirga arabica TaxID=1128671 RepID=UPI00193AAF49|nr:hypothetical protein [Microvirga arabica]MBM1172021.1 hypothetical protein [Microvirga arabica]